MFKLSMMLCNRYGLTDRIGRYILQISSKYTNINTIRYNYEIELEIIKNIDKNNEDVIKNKINE